MTRKELVQKYRDIYQNEQLADKKTLEWCLARDVCGCLGGDAPLDWVTGLLSKVRNTFEQASIDNGYAHDAEHGTYAVYCGKRIQGLESVIAEIEQLKVAEPCKE